MITLYSADAPERLRGTQHDFIWADEVANWKQPETWDIAMSSLHSEVKPQAFITTAPKLTNLILALIKNQGTVVTLESTRKTALLS